MQSRVREDMPIIGRERALIDSLGNPVQAAVKKRHDYTPLRETRRGTEFEVAIRDPDDEPTWAYRPGSR